MSRKQWIFVLVIIVVILILHGLFMVNTNEDAIVIILPKGRLLCM